MSYNLEEIYETLDEFEDEIKWAFDILLDIIEEYHPEADLDDKIQQVRELYNRIFG